MLTWNYLNFVCFVATPQISGPERDVHSGNDGGVFDEPMVDLLKVGGSNSGGRVQILQSAL